MEGIEDIDDEDVEEEEDEEEEDDEEDEVPEEKKEDEEKDEEDEGGEEEEYDIIREDEGVSVDEKEVLELPPAFSRESLEKVHFGMPTNINIKTDLRTYIQGMSKLKKLQTLARYKNFSSSEIFEFLLGEAATTYGMDDTAVLEITALIPRMEGVRYLNPTCILFAYRCLNSKRTAMKNMDEVEKVFKSYNGKENFSLFDLIRYTKYLLTLYSATDYLSDYLK